MSRVGARVVSLPSGVVVSVADGAFSVQGSRGELTQVYTDGFSFDVRSDSVRVLRVGGSRCDRAMHGLYRSLLANMVEGVSSGFSKVLLISGTGYRADLKGNSLLLNVGYSNQVEYVIPFGIEIVCKTPTNIVISGIDKQKVGQVAADIRSIRRPGVYSNRGIRYSDEVVRRKVGKSGIR